MNQINLRDNKILSETEISESIFISKYKNKNIVYHPKKAIISYTTKIVKNKYDYSIKYKSSIFVVNIFLGNLCNLNCIYCYAKDDQVNPIKMDINFAKNYLKHLSEKNFNKIKINFTGGGEPTLYFDNLIKICDFTKKTFDEVSFSIITNGTFNKNVADFLIKNKFKILISNDGPFQTINRTFKNNNYSSLKNVETNVRYLIKKKANLKLRCTVLPKNFNQLNHIMNYFYKFGIKELFLEPIFMKKKSDIFLLEKFLNSLRIMNDFSDFFNMKIYNSYLSFGIFKKKVCNFSLSLTPEGFISACHQVTLNNKKNEPFLVGEYKNIIKIDKNKLQKLQNRTTENILQCKSCFLKYDCAGHCALESYHLSGDLYKIESELCKLKKKYAIKYFKSKVEKSIFGFYPFISQNLKYLIFSDYKIKLNENPYNIYLEKTLKHTKEADIILYNGKFEDLSKQKFPIISTKPIPPCISKIYKKSCFNCIELFTIDKNDNVIFCNKKKGKKFLEYLNRKALYNDYLKTVQLSSKCEYCLHKLRKKCDGRECLN